MGVCVSGATHPTQSAQLGELSPSLYTLPMDVPNTFFWQERRNFMSILDQGVFCAFLVSVCIVFFLDNKKIQSRKRQNNPTTKLGSWPLSTPRAQTAPDHLTPGILGAQPENKPLPLPLSTQGDNTTSCTIQL